MAVDPAAVAARSGVGAAGWERRAAWLDLVTPSLTAAHRTFPRKYPCAISISASGAWRV